MAWNLWQTVNAGQSAAKAAARARSGGVRAMSLWQKHAIFEKNSIVLRDRRADRDRDRRPRRDRPALLSQEHDREGRRRAALHAARTRRPQHLRARGLLQLPFADDPPRCATRSSATATIRSRPRACTTGRSSGAASAPGRISPALGGKYSDEWHRDHLRQPKSVVPGTVMPAYPWLAANDLDYAHIDDDLKVNAALGVPYTPDMIANAQTDLKAQASADAPRRPTWRSATRKPPPATTTAIRNAHHRSRRADRLPAGARHDGRLQALRQQSQHPVRP